MAFCKESRVVSATLLALLASVSARDVTFTFNVPAGKAECFYDYIHEGAFLEIEYQVGFYDTLV